MCTHQVISTNAAFEVTVLALSSTWLRFSTFSRKASGSSSGENATESAVI